MKPFTLNHVVVQQLVFKSIQSFTCVHVRMKNAKVESSLNTGQGAFHVDFTPDLLQVATPTAVTNI